MSLFKVSVLFFIFASGTNVSAFAAPFLQDPLSAKIKTLRQKQRVFTISEKIEPKIPALFKDQKAVALCLQETCGPAAQNRGAYDMSDPWKRETTDSKQQWGLDLRPLLDEVTTAELGVQNASIDRLKYLTRNLNPAKMDRQTLHMIIAYGQLLNEAADISTKTLSIQKTAPFPSVQIEESQLKDSLNQKSAVEKFVLRQILLRAIAPMAQLSAAMEAAPFSNDLLVYLQIHYPKSTSLKTAQTQDANLLLNRLQNLETVIGSFMPYSLATKIDMGILEKAKRGLDLTEVESERYIDLVQKIGAYTLLLDPKIRSSLLQVPFDFHAASQQLAQQIQGIPKTSLHQDPKILAQQIQNSCAEPLRLSQAMLPSKLRINQTRKLLADLKKSAAKIAAKYSVFPTTGEEISRSIQLEFILPETTSVDLEKFRNILLDRLDRAKKLSHQLQEKRNSADTLIFLNAYLTDEISSLTEADPANDEAVIFCNQLEEQAISDLTVSSLGQIYLSRFAIFYPRQGIGIIAHEMGHVFAEALRRQGQGYLSTPFQESAQCVSDRNPFSKKGELSDWAEEDWADFFSSNVLRDFRSTQSPWATIPDNFACAIVVDTGFLYGRNLITPQNDSTHSSGFLRLLNIQSDMEQKVSACEAFQDALTQWSGRGRQCR